MKTVHWFREDLRLLDNPALDFAARHGDVVPVFIYPEGLGAASYWWLHYSLQELSRALRSKGITLIYRTGQADQVLADIVDECGASLVTWNRVYSPNGIKQGESAKRVLAAKQVEVKSFNGQLLIEPARVLNKQGKPFKVFTPFWRHCISTITPSPTLCEPELKSHNIRLESDTLEGWRLLPEKPNWAASFSPLWKPGENGAQQRWHDFLQGAVNNYQYGRDVPGQKNTSLLSPHLVFGEISPRQLWHDMQRAIACRHVDAENGNKFLSELGWREFSRYLLMHFPELLDQPFNARFNQFPWVNNTKPD